MLYKVEPLKMLQVVPSLERRPFFKSTPTLISQFLEQYLPALSILWNSNFFHSKGSLSWIETESSDATDIYKDTVDAADDNNVFDDDGAVGVGADVDAYFEGCN